MIRRTPKPFTVEIRNSRRKPLSSLAIDQDQPHVEWPSAMLDDLRETQEPMAESPPAEVPARRILRAIEAPVRSAAVAAVLEDDEDEAEMPEAPRADEPIGDLSPVGSVSVADSIDPPLAPRQGRARRARMEFPRGERWKARLPASVHRTRGKPRGT